MPKSNRVKSTARKPLVDISNGGKPSTRPKKKKSPIDGDDDAAALDRLLLVRSDLSNLVGEIDELVAQALEYKMISRTASQDIESFRIVLSDMHISLKPWVSRLQQAFGSTLTTSENQLGLPLETKSISSVNDSNVASNNKDEMELELTVSHSPFVSWRTRPCAVENRSQLFLLTPLPKTQALSSKYPGSSKSMLRIPHDKDQHCSLELHPASSLPEKAHDELLDKLEVELTPSTLTTSENQLGQPLETNSISCVNEGNVAPNNKDETELDLRVSPSPLVSWRTDACTVENGRQLFLLTPLPKTKVLSSKYPGSAKTMVRVLHDTNQYATLELHPASSLPEKAHDDFLGKLEVELPPSDVQKPCCSTGKMNSKLESTYVSPLKFSYSKSKKDLTFLSTPCFKTSPPKSSALLDLISENITEPTQISHSNESDGLVRCEVSEGLTSRYQQLLGLQSTNKFPTRKKEADETLDWFLSPPKTCILMQPIDEKSLPARANNSVVPLATPLWKNVESTVRKGKQPGESTLKKELWTRFEEVSRDGLHFNTSIHHKTERKGFLDMLEEASCETTDSDCGVMK